MLITKIGIQNVRNLRRVSFEPHPKITVFCGDNGSGKTSLLESIHLLGTGKSFRTHISKKLVSFGESSAFVHALLSSPNITAFGTGDGGNREEFIQSQVNRKSELSDFQSGLPATMPVGVEKRVNGTSVCKVSGALQSSISGISTILPIQIFAPDVEEVVDGSSKVRRSFLDWGVFHVEHRFHETWKKANQILKQRNALLRTHSKGYIESNRTYSTYSKGITTELEHWDNMLSSLGEQIHSYRKSYLESYIPIFRDTVAAFDIESSDNVGIRYHKGWATELGLSEALKRNVDTDIKKSHTSSGYHRANIELNIGKTLGKDVLSRGQKKSFIFAMKLAQIRHLKETTGKRCVLLLDDIASEVDSKNFDVILSLLEQQESQVFMTTLTNEYILDKLGEGSSEYGMFHVKHGECVKQL